MYHILFGHAEHSKFVVGIDVLYILHCYFGKGNLLWHVKVDRRSLGNRSKNFFHLHGRKRSLLIN
jgi:hypothetical protein